MRGATAGAQKGAPRPAPKRSPGLVLRGAPWTPRVAHFQKYNPFENVYTRLPRRDDDMTVFERAEHSKRVATPEGHGDDDVGDESYKIKTL